ncbi:UNVERIFIED_CONTAM: hypothetical protein PYX00_005730 [Menopon gallinae]|uniref:BTB domain-containing protein n=3 Tax=Menopon gallinae TaxID=328185 RepID=A0AAW2HSM1_9NEOP
MRSSSPGRERKLYSCDCTTCEPPERKTEGDKAKFPVVRKAKSSNIVRGNFDSVNIEIFQPPKEGSFPSDRKSSLLPQSKSNTALDNTRLSEKERELTHERNSYGIWRRCQDSGNYRMPWSMANSHRDTQDKLAGSQIADGTDNTKPEFDNRIFPFQSTPSGNLKVIPQQVVFESKKVSVLVADPRHTKVNIKAELAKQQQSLAVNSGTVENTKELKMMESEEARNVRKHQILSAITLMGGEARGAALSQLMSPGMPPGMAMPPLPKFKLTGQGAGANEDTLYGGDIHDDQDREDDRSIDSDDSPKPEVNLTKLGFMGSLPIDWTKVKLPQKTNLYKHMHYRITNYVNPDCLVQIDDVQFNCHLLVLQCYSAFFNEKTAKDVVKLPPENVSPKAFELIYEWMTYVHGDSYTILTRENILEVFLAAQFLGIKELEEQCWAFVDCEDLFKEDTAFMLYLDAKKYGISAIMELMVPRVMKFFLILVSSKDFLELHLEEVHVLLSSNYISVHSEIEVFMSAVRWLWHDWKERKDSLEQIMSCIRFGLIAPWQLVDIRRNPENPEFLEITSHPGVQQMIDNGLAYAIIKYWYGNQTEDYYHWIDLLGLSEPPSRNWAGEEKNYVTYREFLHDLELYRKEIYYEKEKSRIKRDNAPSAKSKRGNEQSGMTTSPRDTIQQQSDRRSSTKKHSPISVKNNSLAADTMRSEIEFPGYFRKNPFVPPTIWNINTMLREVPAMKSFGSTERHSSRRKYQKASGDGLKSPSAYRSHPVNEGPAKHQWRRGGYEDVRPPATNQVLRREHAAVSIIQRAYRSYKSRMRLRSQIQSKRLASTSPMSSARGFEQAAESREQREARRGTFHELSEDDPDEGLPEGRESLLRGQGERHRLRRDRSSPQVWRRAEHGKEHIPVSFRTKSMGAGRRVAPTPPPPLRRLPEGEDLSGRRNGPEGRRDGEVGRRGDRLELRAGHEGVVQGIGHADTEEELRAGRHEREVVRDRRTGQGRKDLEVR